MICLDFSAISIACLHEQLRQSKTPQSLNVDAGDVNPEMLRHMILNSIRKNNRQFHDFGRMIICTDNRNYWRKSVFRYYKANRKRDRDKSGIDWTLVFETLNALQDDLRYNFPYKVMDVSQAEADDVIAVLARHFHTKETVLILSGDYDFAQLQQYSNVKQYNPVKDQYVIENDPARYLKEHILRGDTGDGVPNFLSADDVFVSGGRQSPIREVKLNVWVTQEPEEFCTSETLANYRRNRTLIDLSQIPSDIEAAILEEFEVPVIGRQDMIRPYLIKHKLKGLLDLMGDF